MNGRYVQSFGGYKHIVITHYVHGCIHGLHEEYTGGSITKRCFYANGSLHGEYKEFEYWGGREYTAEHKVYVDGDELLAAKAPALSRELVIDDKQKLILSLKHGIMWLPEKLMYSDKEKFIHKMTGNLEKAVLG